MALATKNLSKSFDGIQAVDHLSLRFEPGKITSLVGPNGSGKSTLINLITGVIPFDEGAVVVSDNAELERVKAREIAAYGITRTFQNVRLFEQMKVIDNILVVLTERSLAAAFFEQHTQYHEDEAAALLEKVGLWEKRDELAENLSYGQRKLLEIARALAMVQGGVSEARVFFFDEPFAGLFPEMVKIVKSVLTELRHHGRAVVLVEHNMDLIRELSDHLVVIDEGALLAEGEPEEVLDREDVMEAYLGE